MPVQERRVLGRNIGGAINLYGFQFIIQTNSWTLFAVFLAYYTTYPYQYQLTNQRGYDTLFTVQCYTTI